MILSILFISANLTRPGASRILEVIKGLSEKDLVGFVILQDSVLAARGNHLLADKLKVLKGLGVRIYALREDLDARGIPLESLVDGISPISYVDLVDLVMEEYDKIVSWS